MPVSASLPVRGRRPAWAGPGAAEPVIKNFFGEPMPLVGVAGSGSCAAAHASDDTSTADQDRDKGRTPESLPGSDVRVHDFDLVQWLWGRLKQLVRARRAAARRRRLAGETDRMRADIGLSESGLGREASRRFWYM